MDRIQLPLQIFIVVCEFGNRLLLLAFALYKSMPDTAPIVPGFSSTSQKFLYIFLIPSSPLCLPEIHESKITRNKAHESVELMQSQFSCGSAFSTHLNQLYSQCSAFYAECPFSTLFATVYPKQKAACQLSLFVLCIVYLALSTRFTFFHIQPDSPLIIGNLAIQSDLPLAVTTTLVCRICMAAYTVRYEASKTVLTKSSCGTQLTCETTRCHLYPYHPDVTKQEN